MAPRPPSTPLARAVLAEVSRRFEQARDDERARAMKAYMRDQFAFAGIPAPAREKMSREAVADLAKPDEADLVSIARAAWRKPEREYQYFACWYLRRNVRVLTTGFIDTAAELITTKSWWDTVDELAQNVVGPLVRAHRAELVAVMDRWIDADDLWLARTAILHQNRYREATDADRLFAYCLARSGDTDFFLRKAIGWALREYTRVDEMAVRRFLREHDGELSGLSKREALAWVERRTARSG